MLYINVDSKERKKIQKKTVKNKQSAKVVDQQSRFNALPSTTNRGAEAGQENSGGEVVVKDGMGASFLG